MSLAVEHHWSVVRYDTAQRMRVPLSGVDPEGREQTEGESNAHLNLLRYPVFTRDKLFCFGNSNFTDFIVYF